MFKFTFNKTALDAHRNSLKHALDNGHIDFYEYATECKRLMRFASMWSVNVSSN